MNKIAVLVGNHCKFDKITPDSVVLHEHDVHELMFFVKIQGVYFMEGRAYRLKRNDVLLIPPHTQHRIIMDEPCEYDRYNVLLDASLLPAQMQEIIRDIDPVIHLDDDIIESFMTSYDLYLESFDKDMALVGIDSVVKSLLLHMYLLSNNKDRRQTSRVNPIVTRATAYIQQNITTLSGVEEICDELFVTKSHLHHLFKKYLMTTPKKYINAKRLFEAQKLIRGGTSPGEACFMSGFTDYATFYRNYKTFFGHLPSDENDTDPEREQYF